MNCGPVRPSIGGEVTWQVQHHDGVWCDAPSKSAAYGARSDGTVKAVRSVPRATPPLPAQGTEPVAEVLEAGKAFGYDPATGFMHADDGGAPASCIFYVPKDEAVDSDALRAAQKLLLSAKILYQNVASCTAEHHGVDPVYVPWLADCKKDIDVAEAALSSQESSANG